MIRARSIALYLVICVVLTACITPGVAPKGGGPGYAVLLQRAETAEAAGRYVTAAEYYRDAYAARPGRPEHAYQAAELYARARDYRNASESYALVPADGLRWPLLGLSYGRALKQAGQTRGAERVLTDFITAYNGTDRSIVIDLAETELVGLRLPAEEDPDPSVSRVSDAVNTAGDETGPSVATAEHLSFSRRQGGQNRAMVSVRGPAGWSPASPPPGFPVVTGGQLGSGSWSTDGNTYFFTICGGTGARTTERCEIYRTARRLSGAWLQPTKLSDAINAPGANNAYPSAVALEDGRQVVYFSSNRPGGVGGLDVYRATQIDAGVPGVFGELTLLGPAINTPGNEITPTFDRAAQRLTFASDGHPSYGGYDLFTAERREGRYASADNLGRPINSPADDVGLSRPGPAGYAFLVSNRAFPPEKTGTTDDDIFQVGVGATSPSLRATVYAQSTRLRISQAEVKLIEANRGAAERVVATQTATDGAYFFDLAPATTYRVEVRHPDYHATNYPVRTDPTGVAIYGRPIYLIEKGARPQVPGTGEVPSQNPPPTPGEPDAVPGNEPPILYRIQLSATREYDPAEPRYQRAAQLGSIRTEAIPGRDLKRITLGNYLDLRAARTDLTTAKTAGFEDAFIVRYDYGKRYGRIR